MAELTLREALAELDDLIRDARRAGAQERWRADRESEVVEDLKCGRGHLTISPDMDLKGMDVEGMVVVRDGKEYRVVISQAMRGAKDGVTGEPYIAFFIDAPKLAPLQPLMGQFISSESYTRLVEAWRRYYERHEELDRAFNHAPAREGRKSVIPLGEGLPGVLADRQAQSHKLREEIRSELRAVEMKPRDKEDARDEGWQLAMDALKPCECERCRAAR
jgi:hypothetical protein